jgi:predicted small secreted protein
MFVWKGLERSVKVWKELKNYKMNINRVWVVIDKNRLVLWTQLA